MSKEIGQVSGSHFLLFIFLHTGYFFNDFLSSANFFQNQNYFKNNIRVSNGLDPDKDRQNVCPDLVPNCLQSL